ncbi:MAG TPA: DUF3025 domain-containing protein, partial [Ramlibacter sp.]|nr:DUF3025 domain-containing protein [Ramlibacter sp.]
MTDIDWSAPWFAPWRASGEAVVARVGEGMAVHQALNRQGACPVRFVVQQALPASMAYERFVHETRSCPTRPNLHDFFNGLAWLQFPQSKAALNALQAAQIAMGNLGERRGPVRDAVTVFDENGALLHAPPALWSALLARDWMRLFIELRPLWRQARITVFGHALLEKLANPRKDLTAHVWCAPAPADPAASDAWLAGRIDAAALASKPFTPLPLLGIPGWWAENQNFSFYDDSLVFRARRSRQAIKQ